MKNGFPWHALVDSFQFFVIYIITRKNGSTAFENAKEPEEPSAWRQQEPNFDASAARSIVAFGPFLGIILANGIILLMDQILHHLGWLKPYK